MKYASFLVTLLIAIVHISAQNPVVFIGKNNFCLSSGSTSTVTVDDCSTTDPASISWLAPTNGSIIFPPNFNADPPTFQNSCLAVNSTSPTNGTIVIAADCTSASNQLWTVNAGSKTVTLAGTQFCLDLRDGKAAFGTPIQIWTCFKGNTNQIWHTAPPPPTLPSAGSSNVEFILVPPLPPPISFSQQGCLAAASNEDGAPVIIQHCGAGSQNWTLSAGSGSETNGVGPIGKITMFGGSKCLDLTNGNTANGNKLQLWTCFDGNTNQKWSVNNVGTITFAGESTKCVDNTNGNFTDGNRIQIWDCTKGNRNQLWGIAQDFLNE